MLSAILHSLAIFGAKHYLKSFARRSSFLWNDTSLFHYYYYCFTSTQGKPGDENNLIDSLQVKSLQTFYLKLTLICMIQVTFFPRTLYPPHISQRSSDEEDHGARSPPLEVSDEECLRDRVSYIPTGELGKELDLLYSVCGS